MGSLIPYLNFEDGKCFEAMSFYRDCIGGDYSAMLVKEMPEMAAQMPPEMGEAVLHSELKSGRIIIYGSDLNRQKIVDGNSVQLCINCDTEAELRRLFDSLGAGGTVLQPIDEMPWGATYAELRDKYGKSWLFNYQKAPM